MASYAEDEIQTRYYLTPFAVKAAAEHKSERSHQPCIASSAQLERAFDAGLHCCTDNQ